MTQPLSWASRLVDTLGTPLPEITERHIAGLVENAVREDTDLDFKATVYGTSDSQKREFAADIAAMANHRGGLIVIGVREENDVAVELMPVDLESGEEGRLRQIAASNLAPHVAFEVYPVKSHTDTGKGYYLLVVPPSSLRPHAVRKDTDLRYARRDGTTRRWLSEAEVADLYRDRFATTLDQVGRLNAVFDEGLGAMDLDEDEAYVAVGIVPASAGTMGIDGAQVAAVQQWARDHGAKRWWLGFFDRSSSPFAGVGLRRTTLMSIFEADGKPSFAYAELHGDGAGFACQRTTTRLGEGAYAFQPVINISLFWGIAQCLGLLGAHARDHCGAWGDALIEARVVGRDVRLGYLDQMSYPIYDHSREINQATSRHTVTFGSLVGGDQALLASTRLLATDIYNAFGQAEVKNVAPDGTLRILYFRGDQQQLRQFAEERGVPTTEETVYGG